MTDDELKRLFEANSAETRRLFDRVETGFANIDARFSALESKVAETAAETRRHFDIAAEGLNRKLETLAETVMHVDQKIDRTAADIRDEMRRGFAETQAMIKFSHAELDQRVRSLETSHRAIEESQRSLEETVADLQARLERLESTTH